MSYGDLIRDAFLVSWRNKFLWFFGYWLTGLSLGGFSANSSVNTNDPPAWTESFGLWASQNVAAVVGVAVGLARLGLLVYLFFGGVSSGAMAASVAAIDRGESRGFSSTFRAGLSNFWGVLGQAILLLLIGAAIALLFAVVFALPVVLTFVLTGSVAARVLVAVLFGFVGLVGYLAAAILYYVVCQFALREKVVGGRGAAEAIGTGFRLLRSRFGSSLLVWLLFFVLWVSVWIVLIILSTVLAALFALPVLLSGPGGPTSATVAASVALGLILLLPSLLLTGALGSFFRSYWTLAYLRLTVPQASPSQEPLSTDPNPPAEPV